MISFPSWTLSIYGKKLKVVREIQSMIVFFLYRYVLIIILCFLHIGKKIHMHTLNLHHSSSKVLGLGYTMGSKSKWISKIFDAKFQGIFQKYYDHWIQLVPKLRILNSHIVLGKKTQCNNRACFRNLDLWVLSVLEERSGPQNL